MKDCKDPNIFLVLTLASGPYNKSIALVCFGAKDTVMIAIPMAEIRFEQFAQDKVLSDLMSVVEGTSEWDYIVKAMDYLRTKESEGQLEFYSFAKTKWEKMLTECRSKYGIWKEKEDAFFQAHFCEWRTRGPY